MVLDASGAIELLLNTASGARLRANVSAYDAVYVALAEALSTVLVTGDGRLAGVRGLAVAVETV